MKTPMKTFNKPIQKSKPPDLTIENTPHPSLPHSFHYVAVVPEVPGEPSREAAPHDSLEGFAGLGRFFFFFLGPLGFRNPKEGQLTFLGLVRPNHLFGKLVFFSKIKPTKRSTDRFCALD